MKTILLLVFSNGFMTMTWYGHLKHLNDKPLAVAVLVSWGIALFEYMLQVPDALGIQDTVWPVALLPIGYAAETPASTARRVLQEIVGNLSGIPHF